MGTVRGDESTQSEPATINNRAVSAGLVKAHGVSYRHLTNGSNVTAKCQMSIADPMGLCFRNLRTVCCLAPLRLGVSRSAWSDQARSTLLCPPFGPFFRPSWRFEFIAPWNAAVIQREDAKAQRRKEPIY